MRGPVEEQIAYYRARAPEYDDFWVRRGAYQLPPQLQKKWFDDAAEVERAIHDFAPTGDVLELACGTGLFTRHIAQHAARITAVDASPEAIEINRARPIGGNIEFVVADVFTWPFPIEAFDAVVFTYWLSHVPDGLLDAFWNNVRAALRPRGRVFLIDSTPYPKTESFLRGCTLQGRTLNDGRSFNVIKRFWSVDELERYLGTRGWSARAQVTDNEMILYATAVKS